MTIHFENRVALVTGGGAGLGREYALALAARGAKVIIGDLARLPDGALAAQSVAEEILDAGGMARAVSVDVTDEAAVAELVASDWGPVDTLICNAGILRDKSFAKMEIDDFRKVVEVHLIGTAICVRAVWDGMREARYGRIVLTASASGIYGNFGQANYAAAKSGMIGLANTLNIEGASRNIRVNVIAPNAATAMTADIFPPQIQEAMTPENVVPATLFLASEEAPQGVIMGAGGGAFSMTHIQESAGIYLPEAKRSPEGIAAHFAAIEGKDGPLTRLSGPQEQTERYLALRQAATGETLLPEPGEA
ncbi:MAG: SDR family NAD(P)-dependent oxidoreductase [Mangrovicoccus sp.]